MKKGAIDVENGVPTITCNFHNSKFSMVDGSCKVWCSGVMGMPGTGFLAGAMGKMGGKENSPATAYPVSNEDGKLFVEI
jgi:nitrite reductase/ring-hydroxylating ferredoxin subunit